MNKIKVELEERSYEIIIAPGIISEKPIQELKQLISGRTCLVVSDNNVLKLYGGIIGKILSASGVRHESVSFKAGESSKNMGTVEKICRSASSSGLDRSSMLIALGGGVPGDIAGFAASIFMRGIDFVQIPTTLLAMVDSSVGGKTGVDIPEGKNLIGAFWQPKVVIIDPGTLRTLPQREIRCGLAELIKYGMILDSKFFSLLEKNIVKLKNLDMDLYCRIIRRCCELKAGIVTSDERETSGARAVLNYGHTFGHAIETATNYGKIKHGEAVSIGMCMAANFAVSIGMLDEKSAMRQKNLLEALGLPCSVKGISPDKFIAGMLKDKKSKSGKLNLVLPEKIGKVKLVKDIAPQDISSFLKSQIGGVK